MFLPDTYPFPLTASLLKGVSYTTLDWVASFSLPSFELLEKGLFCPLLYFFCSYEGYEDGPKEIPYSLFADDKSSFCEIMGFLSSCFESKLFFLCDRVGERSVSFVKEGLFWMVVGIVPLVRFVNLEPGTWFKSDSVSLPDFLVSGTPLAKV